MNACSYPRRCCAFLLHECMPYYRKTRRTQAQPSPETKNSSQPTRSLLEFFGVNTHKRHKNRVPLRILEVEGMDTLDAHGYRK